MMKRILIVIILFLCFSTVAQKKKDLIEQVAQLKAQTAEMKEQINAMQKAKEVDFEDELQKFSYAYGVSVGENLKTVGYDSLAYHAFAVALEDLMTGKPRMDVRAAQNHARSAIEKLQSEEAKRQSAEGEAFLAKNGKRPEVVTTESGLQYEIIKEGDGAMPVSTDKVKVHYSGMLIDGKVFDSSVERGEPATFGVTQVIKGWQEALQLMQVGDKFRVYIPQNLGYGQRGAGGGEIPPYAALIFEMELLGIEK